MKLYTDNKGAWAGTQSDAKADFGKDYALVEVPVSKDALLKWLNSCSVLSQAHVAAMQAASRIETVSEKTHPQSCSANPNVYDVHDAVLNCDRKHLGSALAAIISRLHDELEEAA
jgi:hypothetical protein